MTTSRTRRCALIRVAGLCAVLALTAGACGGGAPAPEQQASSGPQVQVLDAQGAPVFRVAPFWPKPLPNKWSMQQVVDLYVDRDDHVWIINRPADARPDEVGAGGNPPRTDCCVVGPMIVHFDPEGNVVNAWGGPDHHPGWPGRLQTIGVDREKNVYVSGTMPGDSIIKFSSDGKFLWDFGHRGPKVPGNQVKMNNQQTDIFPPGIGAFDFDEDEREIYIADGFLNKRVLVYDMDTGAFKRGWGGHGMPLSEITNEPTPPYEWTGGPPPDQQDFAPALHCVHVSTDKHVYVCERGMNRVQEFTTDGKWVKDFHVRPETPSRGAGCGGIWHATAPPCGTVYNLALSRDPEQKYVFVADGTNNRVWIFDRQSAKMLGSFGGNGRYAGQLHWIDAIKVDSKGNIYTGEVEDGKRVQKFVPVMAAAQ
jgi:DNA-binding beta-propeller fold protein YncE